MDVMENHQFELNLNILSAVYRVILFMVSSSQRASFLARCSLDEAAERGKECAAHVTEASRWKVVEHHSNALGV